MRSFVAVAAFSAALAAAVSAGHSGAPVSGVRRAHIGFPPEELLLAERDASTTISQGTNNREGEAHDEIKAPKGADFTSFPVGKGGEELAVFWADKPNNKAATSAYIMIHGKVRNGGEYWTTMNTALQTAIDDKVAGVDPNAIVIAPQFFSAKLNSGQYTKDQLAWGDVNAWQAGDPATHPDGTTLTSFDAIDALVDGFADTSKYPNMKNVTVVGHGGGAQLSQRYASVAADAPSNVHVRYIHGDPSSCAYFTTDRPVTDTSIAGRSKCKYWNTWRYGFDNFTGTAAGLKTPQEYFQQYITRDVVSLVGYQDVDASGDQYCMAMIQGGQKRRDRNLSWWRYINTLAKTNEDLTGFPGNFSTIPDWSNISNHQINTKLIVIEDADHDANKVFGSDVGRAALFQASNLPTGWRPEGWNPAGNGQNYATTSSSNSTSGAKSSSSGGSSGAAAPQTQLAAVGAAAMAAVVGLAALL